MEENKNMEQNNVAANNEEQMNNQAPANEETPKEGIISKGKNFFKKNGKKLLTGAAIVGAVGVGVAADRFGLPFIKKKSTPEEETPVEE